MVTSRKLRPYFHAHSIKVLTNYLLCQVLQKPEASRRLLKWAIKLGYVNFWRRMGIKGKALIDFIAEFTYVSTAEVARTVDVAEAVKVVEAGEKENSALTQEDTQ